METHVGQSEISCAHDAFMHKANQFRYSVSFVPEDKFEWMPTDTAKSTKEIMAHCALANFGLASLIGGERLGGVPEATGEFFPWLFMAQKEKRSPEDTKALYDESVQVLSTSYRQLSESRLAEVVETPFGMAMAVRDLLDIPGLHLSGHTAQIEYLQTCWGDQEFHFLARGTEAE